jgi:hypothetical protein
MNCIKDKRVKISVVLETKRALAKKGCFATINFETAGYCRDTAYAPRFSSAGRRNRPRGLAKTAWLGTRVGGCSVQRSFGLSGDQRWPALKHGIRA